MHQGGLDWILEILTDHGPGQTYHEPLVGKTVQSTRPGSGKRTDQRFSRKSPPQQPLIFLKVLLLPPTLRGVFLGCELRSQQDTAASNPRFPSLEAKTSSFFSLTFPTDPQEELMALCRGSGVSRAALRVTLPL